MTFDDGYSGRILMGLGVKTKRAKKGLILNHCVMRQAYTADSTKTPENKKSPKWTASKSKDAASCGQRKQPGIPIKLFSILLIKPPYPFLFLRS